MALVTLLDNSQVDTSNIVYSSPASPSNPYGTFIYTDPTDGTQSDLSLLIPTPVKTQYFGFDPSYQNDANYTAQYAAQHGGAAPPDVGSTSTAENFFSQLYNDPLSAPLTQLNTVVSNAGKTLAASTGLQTILLLALAAGAIYFFWPRIEESRQPRSRRAS